VVGSLFPAGTCVGGAGRAELSKETKMANIAYIKYRPSEITARILGFSNTIINEFQADGFDVTLRQLYYKLIARDLFPEEWKDKEGNKNNPKSYSKFKAIMKKGRLGGMVDWDSIVDRTRVLKKNSHWASIKEIIDSCAKQFMLDSRRTQDVYIEVWVEKEAMSGVLKSVCPRLDVPYFACKGYDSLSMIWRAAMRFRVEEKTRCVVVLYLGDHDPSGIDMVRDIQKRLDMFGCRDTKVKRIGLTMAQVRKYKPPPCPAKITDSRYEGYREKFGDEAWELDALDPRTIVELIEQQVGGITSAKKIELILEEQDNCRSQLRNIAESI